MNGFSSSSIRFLMPVEQSVVEGVFLQLRDPSHVARQLGMTKAALNGFIQRARKRLAKHQIQLPDRRRRTAIGSGQSEYI